MKMKKYINKSIFVYLLLVQSILLYNGCHAKKKKSKMSHKQYTNVLLFTYGLITNDYYLRFKQNAETFEWPHKVLKSPPTDVNCTSELMKELGAYKKPTYLVLLVNAQNVLLNGDRVDLIKKAKHLPLPMIEYQNGGLHLLADIDHLKSILDKNEKRSIQNILNDKAIVLDQQQIETFQDVFLSLQSTQLFVPEKFLEWERSSEKKHFMTIDGNQPIVLVDSLKESNCHLCYLSNVLSEPKPLPNIDKKESWPVVTMVLIVDNPSLFVEEYFDKLAQLDYPPNRLHVHILCKSPNKESLVHEIIKTWHQRGYLSLSFGSDWNNSTISNGSKFVFLVRSSAHLEVPSTLKVLVGQNVNVVTPFLMTNEEVSFHKRVHHLGWGKSKTFIAPFYHISTIGPLNRKNNQAYERIKQGQNFGVFSTKDIWTTMQGWDERYKTGHKGIYYGEHLPAAVLVQNMIQHKESCCLWTVRHIRDCFLIKSAVWTSLSWPEDQQSGQDQDDWLSNEITSRGISLHLINDLTYGQVVNLVDFPATKSHAELFRMFENHDLWERRYIRPTVVNAQAKVKTMTNRDMRNKSGMANVKEGLCPDTFEIEMFNDIFCDHILEEALDHNDLWEEGKYDVINGAAEDGVPQEIPLHKLGLEMDWLGIINFYLFPRQVGAFNGLNVPAQGGHFVIVRQPPGNAYYLPRDSKILGWYRHILPLKRHAEGQMNFYRYNCSTPDPSIGTILLCPEDLTHPYVNLPVAKDPRYTLISRVGTTSIEVFCYHGKYMITPESHNEKVEKWYDMSA